ncbi:MAG TPA: SpoIID/LytB domain-containing protein [Candidatus Eisenbacteria bacterium]|uniref:SpoIID/LytB domain-containing protein n=1 Tax=Eiseniibacteriota bacterium TaxID=2212470 RepID=A0A7V2AWH2_UNCEI|nr:SpoIID/LytB domain-containing protein [Candidatus Eisenbacteria bacterium]
MIPPVERPPVVRVLVLEPCPAVRVRIPSAFFVAEGPGLEPLERLDSGGEFVVRRAGGGLAFRGSGTDLRGAPAMSIHCPGSGHIYINGKPYRGDFTFRAAQDGVIVINDIEIDDYLKGVLPAEIGYLRPDQYEAYLVQAIASRSYSLSKLEEKRMEMYDLRATIMDQVYRGVQGEHPDASRAVDETRGLVAFFEGAPARTFYSSCCGGHTADIRVGWPWKPPAAFLQGVRDTKDGEKGRSFCHRSPHFRWRVHWSGRTLERILEKTLPRELGVKPAAIGTLEDIVVRGVSPSGRVEAMEFVTDRGRHVVVGDRIRWVLLPQQGSDAILKSTLFKIDVTKSGGRVSAVNLVGGGNGHGIGMCQTGAIRMAEKGYSCEEILAHYYPGTRIVRYYP